MSLETAALDHACNVVRRQFEGEFRDLTLFFILHAPTRRPAELEARRRDLLALPGGAALYPALKKSASDETNDTRFFGFAFGEEKSFFSLISRQKKVAVFFVNTAAYSHEAEMRQGIYHLAWHALSLIDHYKNEDKALYMLEKNIVRPAQNPRNQARDNMLGDVFSALMIQLQGQRNFIHALARRRCNECLTARPGHHPEDYPYPIAIEATRLVYDELRHEKSAKAKIISQAMEMTKEIGLTYDDNAIGQWQAFSTAAQEMAWLGQDKNKILSAGVYTSEDPYLRSTAYIASEILNIDPAVLTDTGFYNPFTDQEANERLHHRLCYEVLDHLLATVGRNADTPLFFDEARKHNAQLLNGHAAGWCGYALLEAATAYKEALLGHNPQPAEAARTAFDAGFKALSWDKMIRLSHFILQTRRKGINVTLAVIQNLQQEDEAFYPVIEALERAPPEIKKAAPE